MKTTQPANTTPDAANLRLPIDTRRTPIWRRIITAPVTAAVRLHQYRNLHSAMVSEALCKLDRCDQS